MVSLLFFKKLNINFKKTIVHPQMLTVKTSYQQTVLEKNKFK